MNRRERLLADAAAVHDTWIDQHGDTAGGELPPGVVDPGEHVAHVGADPADDDELNAQLVALLEDQGPYIIEPRGGDA